MSNDDPRDSLIPGCEICTESDMIDRDFHFNRRLFFYDTTGCKLGAPPSRKTATIPVRRGILGFGSEAKLVVPKTEFVSEKHAKLTWRGKEDEYDLQDVGSKAGTYLVLSCSRPSRECVRLQTNDVFYLAKNSSAVSRRTSSTMSSPFAYKNTIQFNDYIKFKVTKVFPENPSVKPPSSQQAKNSRKSQRRRTFTLRRDSDYNAPNTLAQLKLKDIDMDEIIKGFESAADSYKADQNLGSLLNSDQVELVRKTNASKNVAIRGVIPENGEDTEPQRIRRNVLGGASVLEEEAMLDSVLCDDTVSQHELQAIEKSAKNCGIRILTDPHSRRKGSTGKGGSFVRHSISENAVGPQFEQFGIELEVLAGSEKHKGKRYSFGLEDISLGSHQKNTIVIPELASFHIRIERDSNNFYWLWDMSMGNMCGTLLEISGNRTVTVQKDDVFRLGPTLELQTCEVPEHPGLISETWDSLGLMVQKSRYSWRYRQLTGENGYLFDPSYFVMSNSDEMTVGRKVQECDIAVQDYEMPAYACVINRFSDNRYFLNVTKEAKKKGVFIELSNRRGSSHTVNGKAKDPVGKIHTLAKGDTFKVGRSQITVLLKKCERAEDLKTRVEANERTIKAVKLFSSLDPEEISLLASSACTLKFKLDDIIIRQGEKVSGVFIICEGSAQVYHDHCPKKVLATVGENIVLGEMALFTGFPASASIRAVKEVTCLFIDYNMAKAIIHPTNFEVMRVLIEHRISQAHVHDLQQLKQFKHLDSNTLLALAGRMFRVILKKGSTLIEKGTPHECMYIVASGTLYLSYDEKSRPTPVKPLAKRKSFTPVYGGDNIFAETVVMDQGRVYLTPFSVISADTVVLYGLRRSDYVEVTSKEKRDIQKEASRSGNRVDDFLLHGAKSIANKPRATSQATSSLNISPSTDFQPSEVLLSSRSTAKITPESSSTGGTAYIPGGKRPSRRSMSSMSSLGSSSATSNWSGTSNTKSVARFRSRRSSVSDDEGSEGMSCRYKRACHDKTFSSEDVLPETSDVETDADSDYDEDENDETVDTEIDAALFSKRSELELKLQGTPISDLEEALKDEPYYIVLKCVMGSQKRQVFIITETVSIMGRWTSKSRKNEGDPFPGRRFISLNDRTVSRVNSMIQYRNGDYFLNDLESKYGTHLKLLQQTDYKLEIGDVVTCSQHTFTVYGKTTVLSRGRPSKCSIL